MCNEEIIRDFSDKIVDVTDKFKESMPPYEMVHQLIVLATDMALHCAPNELIGIKTILQFVENGISSYEETAS